MHPVFEAFEVFGGQRNAASRGSSTTASSKDEAHVKQAKSMLAVIVKKVDTAMQTTDLPSEQALFMNMEGLAPALEKIAGKNAAKNRRKKEKEKVKGRK